MHQNAHMGPPWKALGDIGIQGVPLGQGQLFNRLGFVIIEAPDIICVVGWKRLNGRRWL